MNVRRSGAWFIAALICVAIQTASAVDYIPLGSSWKYTLGAQEASVPAAAWRQGAFDDAAWSSGTAPLGYDTGGTPGTAAIATVLPDPRTAGNPSWNSVYFRKSFTVADPSRLASLVFTLFVDDGAVVWLNGTEVGRINVPDGELPYNGAASVADETRTLVSSNLASFIIPGQNVIAVHTFNGAAASSDFVFEGSLAAVLDEPPAVTTIDPPANAIATTLTSVGVTFSENVNGVDASDLLINGAPAATMLAVSPREYVFSFPEPPTGTVNVAWSLSTGITDQDMPIDSFVPGPGWSYTLDPNVISAPLVISEFMTDNGSGISDEDGNRSDWIELYNPGTIDRNLNGWFLTDTATNLTKWRFPSVNLAANKYLLVWASDKNRTNSAAPLHTNFKLGKTPPAFLALVDAQTNIVSSFNYPAQTENVSYGRDRVDPNLLGFFLTPTPGAQNATSGAGFAGEPTFSLESGVYTNDSLVLTITAAPGTLVRYTFDGSEPTNGSPVYTGPITFGTNLMIKARAFATNAANLWPSAVVARTFLFLDGTTREFSSNIPLIVISTHGAAIPANVAPGQARRRGAFLALDTFRGRSALQGKADFLGLAQFEVVGQTSAGADFLKKPHRVEINDELGNDRKVPLLGMPSESDWMLRNPWSDKCLMNDFLGYELWEQMGHYSCRRRLVEVFIDTGGGKLTYPGDYYGVMVLLERIEVGNDRVDISELTPSHTNEPAISGGYIFKKDKDSAGDTAFTTVGGAGHPAQTLKFHEPKPRDITMLQSNWIRNYVRLFESTLYAANWTNATGTNHYSHYIDVDAFVDQHLHVEFTKQIDGYRLSSYYTKDRNKKLAPNPVWDWNLSFGNANYLEGGKTNGWYWNRQPSFDGWNVSALDHIWLRRLIYGLPAITTAAPWTDSNGPGDPDFRQKITDRWEVLRTNVLNGDRLVARVDELAGVLSQPAARNYAKYPALLNSYQWPNPSGLPYDVNYVQPTYAAIISEMKKWIKGRSVWMDNQFLRKPAASRGAGQVTAGAMITLSAPAGTIYFTLDGTDPRLPGGGIAPGAQVYSGPITLNGNAKLVARAYSNPTTLWTPWSAALTHTYVVATPSLVITELMYHPSPRPAGSTNSDEDFEYIELRNTGSTALNVGGFVLGSAVDFVFPSRIVGAGERVVVVKNRFAFTNRYGTALEPQVIGEFSGNLPNSESRLSLHGAFGEPILDFTYSDEWYPITDGLGFSLVAVNENAPAEAWSTRAQWRAGGTLNGTPAAPDGAPPVYPQVVINEALTKSVPVPPYDTIELWNRGANPVDISGWFLTDNFSFPKKFRIPAGTIVPAGGFVTVDETAFNVSSPGNTPFGLSSQGEELFLFSADVDRNLTGYFHGFDFGPAVNGVTFGRHVTSTGEEHFVAQQTRTLGAANSGPLVGPIVISEIMYRPSDVFTNGAYWNVTEEEFIELLNISGAAVPLFDPARPTNTWKLDEAVNFVFPTNVTLPAFGYALAVNFDPGREPLQLAAFRSRFGIPAEVPIFGPYTGSLPNNGGKVTLRRPEPAETDGSVPYAVADRVEYSDGSSWPVAADGYGHALHRLAQASYGNDPMNWAAGAPTPGNTFTGGTAPVISFSPLSQTVPATASVTFGGSASGPGPIRYQWRFNGSLIQGATNNVLTIPNVQPIHSGDYQLVALNDAGSAISAPARLTVVIAALITQHPSSQIVTNGTNVAFSVTATTENGPLTYQWFRNGVLVPDATNSVLSLTNVQDDPDSGSYVVAVTDAVGTVYSTPATLHVLLRPEMVGPVPPLRITAVAGESITLSAETRGTRPMFYRWQRVQTNGATLIMGNRLTNSSRDFLTINNIPAIFDGAIFRVFLTNYAHGAFNLVFTNAHLMVLADSNANGIPDTWETAYFGSPTGAGRDVDADGDGMSNWAEYIAGTDPTDSLSFLQVIASNAGGAAITFSAVSNRTYSVEYKDGLGAGVWTKLTDVVARHENWTPVLPDAAAGTNRFYRIVTPRQN